MEEISLCAEYVWYYYGGLAVLLGTALTGVFVLPYFNVPYGRFQANWIVSIPTWLGWLVMEAPSFISYVWMTWALTQASVSTFSWGSLITKPAILIPMTMWVVHYANRSFIYPFRLTSRNKPMSVLPVLSGVLFNVFNGSANAYALQCPRTALAIVPPGLRFLVSGHEYLDAAASTISSAASKQVFVSAVTVLGAVVMVLGWLINYHSDGLLRSLRPPGSKDLSYKVPRGGLFEYVSVANYFGEIVEWFGHYLATLNPASFCFFLATFGNLVPRALAYHRDYTAKFKNYPKHRKAVIPFVL